MQTLLLDRTRWDLVLDVYGNIAVASDPYSVAQDAASAIKLFLGELWYDTTQGVPYFQQILGQWPPLQLIKSQLQAAALTVPEVTAAVVTIQSFTGRAISGQVQVTTATGQIVVASF